MLLLFIVIPSGALGRLHPIGFLWYAFMRTVVLSTSDWLVRAPDSVYPFPVRLKYSGFRLRFPRD